MRKVVVVFVTFIGTWNFAMFCILVLFLFLFYFAREFVREMFKVLQTHVINRNARTNYALHTDVIQKRWLLKLRKPVQFAFSFSFSSILSISSFFSSVALLQIFWMHSDLKVNLNSKAQPIKMCKSTTTRSVSKFGIVGLFLIRHNINYNSNTLNYNFDLVPNGHKCNQVPFSDWSSMCWWRFMFLLCKILYCQPPPFNLSPILFVIYCRC